MAAANLLDAEKVAAANLLAAEKVASNDDLLLEIFLTLPVKSLLRFKSVSKHWLYLISNPPFIHLRQGTPSGLLVHWRSRPRHRISISHLDFVSLDENYGDGDDDDPDFSFFPNFSEVVFMSSCNGLVCCVDRACHVVNPTTRQIFTVPQSNHLSHLRMEGVSLAFDPSKSPHYKLVCIWSSPSQSTTVSLIQSETFYQIEVYSSETRSWKVLDLNFTLSYRHRPDFYCGIYWKDAIVWLCRSDDSLYFQIEEEQIGTIPRLTNMHEEIFGERGFCYGESGGHFYLVERTPPSTEVEVHELRADFSGWVAKYSADLGEVGRIFPQMIEYIPGRVNGFRVLSMFWGEGEDGNEWGEQSYLVLSLPGKIVRLNLEDKRYREVCDVEMVMSEEDGRMAHGSTKYFVGTRYAHPYIHSLFSVAP